MVSMLDSKKKTPLYRSDSNPRLYYSPEEPQPTERRIAILTPSPDTQEDPTSISKRERMPKPVEASTPRREDTHGP